MGQGFDWDTIRGTGTGYVNLNYPGLPPAVGTGTEIPPSQDRAGYATNGTCSFNFGSATRPASTWRSAMARCEG